MLQVIDDALRSATQARNETSNDADAKFKEAIDALSAYEKKYHSRETVTLTMAREEAKDTSPTFFNQVAKVALVRECLELCFATY